MQSAFHLPNRRTSTAATLLALVVTLVFLIVRHVTIGVEIGAAEPSIVFANKLRPVASAQAKPPVKQVAAENGPGGSQPWVRWNYIP
ncbi:MAG: hypothetical protein ABI852_07615 [Gemmatimonadaceae bacterium]